jgi:hypothetical protein
MMPPEWKKEIEDAIDKAAQAGDEKRERTEEKQEAAIATPLRRLVDHFEAYQQQQDSDARKKRKIDVATIIGLFLTAMFALFQGVIFYFQLGEMEKVYGPIDRQAIATNQLLVASNRAWLAPFEVRLTEAIVIDKPILMIIRYQNIGKSPAIDVGHVSRSGGTLPPEPGKGAETIQFPENTFCTDPDMIKLAGVVYPNAPGNEFYNTYVASNAPMLGSQEIIDGKQILFIMGCYRYSTFNEAHHSGFCFYLDPSNSGKGTGTQFHACLSGDFAD